MRRNRLTKATPLIAGLLTGLLLAILAVPLSAETARPSHPLRGFEPAYDAAHEVTIKGTVREIVTKHTPGSPIGVHVIVSGMQGQVDAHLGSFLAKDTQAALHAGLPVEIVGAMTIVHGRQFLLARQITFGDQTVTVRTRTGFLAHSVRRPSSKVAQTAKYVTNGGAR